jgi:penicillin-binding protein 1A
MRVLRRIVAVIAGLALLVVPSIFGWLYLYTADLPSVATLDQYEPSAPAEIRTETGSVTHVVPTNQFGSYLPGALLGAEGQPDPRGPIRAAFSDLLRETPPKGQMYSWQIARSLVHNERSLPRQIDEIRVAQQIHHRFNQQQILTIYMNRVPLGQDITGVEDASLRYFGKQVSDLSLGEAALIAGLIRSPSHDSPINHPERAVQRRNWVLDKMVHQGLVSKADADQAEAAPLIVKQTASSDPTYDWKRCALTIATLGPQTNGLIHARQGEEYKTTPVIRFEVLESGETRNAILTRSSGVADTDNYVLTSIKNMRYKERPLGCGILENQATVNVDF